MCGILGEISHRVNLSRVDQAMGCQFSRGPDSHGLFQEPGVVFGHRRLAIMDISVHSAQPMQFEDLVMVFNGAIYNYRELRTELKQKGYSFYSDGDTEVLLKGFHCWGKEVLSKCNGMFAFAVWNRGTRTLFAARDRLGIKPFYYSVENRRFTFASNTAALLALGVADTSLNRQALQHYFSFHTVVPAPLTVVNGIRKLPQGCSLSYHADEDHLELHEPYWSVPTPAPSGLSYEECLEELTLKLEQAVERRMTAAVDVGVLLSGGLDSSLITALANKHHPELHTFSIGFESTEEEKGDEFEYSDVIVDYFKTRHTKIPIEKERMLSALPKAVASMSEPMGSHDAIGFYLLSQEVSRSIKVVQSGQGADEIFAGYHWYPKIAASEGSAVDAYEACFFDRDFQELNQLLDPKYQMNTHVPRDYVEQWFSKLGDTAGVDKALHIDSGVMLVDDPVKRVDNMTMSWGLEARVPFLDHELVETAFTIPAEFKYADGGKKILKDVARKYIPSDVIDRPKGYFPVPALKYIKGDYLEMIRTAVDSPRARERRVLDRSVLNEMLRNPDDCITRLRGNTLWQYAVLELWLQSHDL